MKPLKLILRAFGPFAGEQIIDFNELADRTFFLIHGPTGSGKTCLLDAICYALYGETSGGDREGKQMRSDHADPGVSTEVIFDFALGDERYRAARQPEQRRPRMRGEGDMVAPAKATLWRLRSDGADEILASKGNTTTEEIERLLGFKASQFRQVVLLPQGKFRELLMADSSKREEILEVLFQTEVYHRIEAALKEAARVIREDAGKFGERKKLILENAGMESKESLETELDGLRTELEGIRSGLTQLREKEAEARESLDTARMTAKKFVELDEAETSIRTLEAMKGKNEEKRAILDRGRRAFSLRDVESIGNARIGERDEALARKLAAEQSHESALREKERAEHARRAEMEREPAREAARAEYERLRELPGKVKELEDAERECQIRQKTVGNAEKQMETARKGHADTVLDLAELQKSMESEKEIAAREPVCIQESDRAKKVRELGEKAAVRRSEREDVLRNKIKSAALLDKKEKELAVARGEMERMEREWFGGQAAALAHGLIPGAPCPVCGSTEHPSPAVHEGALPTEAGVNAARTQVRLLDREYMDVRDTINAQVTEITRLESEIAQIFDFMGDRREASIDSLRKWEKEAKNALARAVAARETASLLQETMEKKRSGESAAKERVTESEQNLAEEEKRLAATEALVEERKAKIPDALRTTAAIQKALVSAKETYDTLVGALEKAKEGFDKAARGLVSAEANAQNALALYRATLDRAEAAEREFLTRLGEAGFADRHDYTESRITEMEIARLEKETSEFDRTFQNAVSRVERARASAEGLERPDIEPFENRVELLKTELEDLIKRETTTSNSITNMEGWRETLETLLVEIEKRESRYRVIGRISEVANGENPYRMTFQRFVLATLLDDVLEASSERLRLMSQGRFELRRTGGPSDRRRSAGLDLALFDSYTGTERPVNTFSGGESFLASLSLALGLADVVQTYAGGIRLETMFVDEGFGSLDPEALELAFRALVDLQKDGRLVGIISHVPELRERIDARLEVTPGRRGSSARFVV